MIHWSTEGGVTVAEIDRAERHNALDVDTVAELFAHVSGERTATPLVITGRGPTFCSGFDLRSSDGASFVQHADRLFDALAHYPAPVIAALNGPAIGMGCLLAAASDLRVGCERSWLEIPAARVGTVMGRQYIDRISARFGLAIAQLLFVGSRRVDARRAHELGALHALADDPRAEATAWALHTTALHGEPIAAHKAMLNERSPSGEG